jgi:hypothetical protein
VCFALVGPSEGRIETIELRIDPLQALLPVLDALLGQLHHFVALPPQLLQITLFATKPAPYS